MLKKKKREEKYFSLAGFRLNGMPDLFHTLFMLIQNTEHWCCQMASAAATTQSENAFISVFSVTDYARTRHQLSKQNPATTQAVRTVRKIHTFPWKRSGCVKHGQLTYDLFFYMLEEFELKNKAEQKRSKTTKRFKRIKGQRTCHLYKAKQSSPISI